MEKAIKEEKAKAETRNRKEVARKEVARCRFFSLPTNHSLGPRIFKGPAYYVIVLGVQNSGTFPQAPKNVSTSITRSQQE